MPKFLGEIKQNGGDFALIDSRNIRGGFMQVSTIKERDSIIPDKLLKGMHCYVEEVEEIFEWRGTEWEVYKVNSNDIDKAEFLTVSQKVKDIVNPIYDDNGEITHYGITVVGNCLFKEGDLIGWDISATNTEITGKFNEISYIRDNVLYISKSEKYPIPSKHQVIYLVGSTSDIVRRSVIAIHPYQGAMVISQFLNVSLEGINTNYTFRLGQHSINKWKVYGEDVYFKGTFIDKENRNISDIVSLNQETINTGLTGLRREFGYDNLLNNPYFIGGMDCWLTKNTATYFKAAGKFIMTNKTLLSAKRDGAYVIIENGQAVLRLIKGYVTQKNENLKKINDLDNTTPPYYVTLIFSYKPVTSGTLKAFIKYKSDDGATTESVKAQQDITQSSQYIIWKSTFLWDGKGDFSISYDGEIKIQTLVLRLNEVKNFENKYKRLFELSDTLVEMAEKYITQNNT